MTRCEGQQNLTRVRTIIIAGSIACGQFLGRTRLSADRKRKARWQTTRHQRFLLTVNKPVKSGPGDPLDGQPMSKLAIPSNQAGATSGQQPAAHHDPRTATNKQFCLEVKHTHTHTHTHTQKQGAGRDKNKQTRANWKKSVMAN
ncbi:hypothetical protein PoB_002075300 [Plakobranchus ocellatus]|uniref:Uncharacterized protein n=1 Tax=Plakobranchus ocellatus TaxID=259542 RepID=A0AAV3ZHG8_9GAST|nr:hypothetical protein PoB_002075300 [Plakobranchus ocellatus]